MKKTQNKIFPKYAFWFRDLKNLYFLSGLAIKEKHDRFTTEPFKHLFDQFCGRYRRLSDFK